MRKNKLNLIFVFLILLIFSCKEGNVKEIEVNRISYYYSDTIEDSQLTKIEHFYFDKDSNIVKYFNLKDGYFFTAERNNNNMLVKKFYDTDSIFLYKSISELNDNNLELKTIFFDSVGKNTYKIVNAYKQKTSFLLKQQRIFSDNSMQTTLYKYDNWGNLIKKIKIEDKDTVIEEFHKIKYDKDLIIIDTITFETGRKIIENKYKGNLLFYRVEKFEKKSDSINSYLPLSNAYWKKYYEYNKKGKLIEIRNFKMYRKSKNFNLASIIKYKYLKDDLIQKKDYYNSKNQIIYSVIMKYKFY